MGDFVLRRMFVDSGHISNRTMGNNHMIAVIKLLQQKRSDLYLVWLTF